MESSPEPKPATSTPADANLQPPSPIDRFIESMIMTYEMWHDGNGYDLEALAAIPPKELATIERRLIDHHPRDWRDIEALARIDSPGARAAVEAALKSANGQVRREAMKYVPEKVVPQEREALLLRNLQIDDIFGGLSGTIDEAAEFHPPAVVDALFRGALNRDGKVAVHFAALLFYIHGKSKEPFDWDHRPFFLRFDTPNREERKAVFTELCQIVGVDAGRYLH